MCSLLFRDPDLFLQFHCAILYLPIRDLVVVLIPSFTLHRCFLRPKGANLQPLRFCDYVIVILALQRQQSHL